MKLSMSVVIEPFNVYVLSTLEIEFGRIVSVIDSWPHKSPLIVMSNSYSVSEIFVNELTVIVGIVED
jgi:hypothetical protein